MLFKTFLVSKNYIDYLYYFLTNSIPKKTMEQAILLEKFFFGILFIFTK